MNQALFPARWAGRSYLLPIVLGVCAFATPTPVFAVLGGSEASVQTDQAHMQASMKSTHTNAYTVHEMKSTTGTVVREYAASGTVFGVAWQGHWPPDMRQLLGSYFDMYQQELQAQTAKTHGRTPVHVVLPGLVVNVTGHPGSFKGMAYVPGMVPQGVKTEEIR